MLRYSSSILAVVVVWIGASLTPGDARASLVLAQYNFPGTPNSLAATTVGPNLTAGDVNFNGSNASQNTNQKISNALIFNAADNSQTETSAFTNNSFLAFTLTPGAGFPLTVSSLTFQAGNINPSSYFVRSSLDNYGSDLGSGAISSPYPSLNTVSVDLSNVAAFQNLTTAVTFRIYDYVTQSSSGNLANVIENLTLNAPSAAVPEPSSLVLCGLAVLGLSVPAGLRRLKARQSMPIA